MLPIIHHNDELYVFDANPSKLKVNDIVIFKGDKRLIAHRLIFVDKNFAVTKGDSNPHNDGRMTIRKIVGKVEKIRRNGQIYSLGELYLIQSSIYYKEILKIIRNFNRQKIEYLILKGLPLHLYYQGTTPQRVYHDCDLMIRRKDFLKIKKIMKQHGYGEIIETAFDKKTIPINERSEISYSKIVNGVPVIFDLHFEPAFLMAQTSILETLYEKTLMDELTNDLFKNKRSVTVKNQEIYILNPEYLLAYLALHFFSHSYRESFRLHFMSHVVKKERLSVKKWLQMSKIINHYRVANFVYPSFKMLVKHTSLKVPEAFFNSLNITNLPAVKQYSKTDISSDESWLMGGANKFLIIYRLSQRPELMKPLVFVNPKIIYKIIIFLKSILFSYLREGLKIHSNRSWL